jgi:EmrB/QacA subfamily drug resistance transporter
MTTAAVDVTALRPVSYGTAAGRWVLVATIGGSAVAMLDATVVNVALPALGDDLNANVSGLQWVLNGYMLSLASLILLAGSLGDRYGRKRIFITGVAWFALASLLCAIAQSVGQLVAARVLQGIGGALLTPGSLAIIEASFRPEDRGRAIGSWSGLGSLAAAAGPFLGGYLVDAVGWRWVFLVNLPVAAAVIVIASRHVPESRDPEKAAGLDVAGAVAGATGLAGLTYALIEAGEQGASVAVVAAAIAGALVLGAFVIIERRSHHPMLPPDIFRSSQFSWTNVVTFSVYGGLGSVFFLLIVQLQVSLGYTPIQAGAASLPVTGLMLLLSARAGRLSQRIGPRLLMSVGPVVAGVGIGLLTRVVEGSSYLASVLPAVTIFGVGLGITVAPLTTTVLAAVDERHSGIASGVNNAVARTAQLLAVAVLPVIAGLVGDAYNDPALFTAGFQEAMLISAGLVISGGVIAWFTIKPMGADQAGLEQAVHRGAHAHCDLHGPPYRRNPSSIQGRDRLSGVRGEARDEPATSPGTP